MNGGAKAPPFMSTKHKSLVHKLNLRTSRRTELQNVTDE